MSNPIVYGPLVLLLQECETYIAKWRSYDRDYLVMTNDRLVSLGCNYVMTKTYAANDGTRVTYCSTRRAGKFNRPTSADSLHIAHLTT